MTAQAEQTTTKPYDESLFEDDKDIKEDEERLIMYDTIIKRPNNYKPLMISFDEVDKYDFSSNSFIEYIKSVDFVHLYFDFDSISTMDELGDVIEWLDSLKEVFGSYSIGGYTNDVDVNKKYKLRLFIEGNHYASVHVVFYETMISTADLTDIMKYTKKTGFITKGVHKLCDPNVYNLVAKKEGETITQKFRHVLSRKIYSLDKNNKDFTKNKANYGFIVNDTKPSNQIVQIKGNERIILKEEWMKVFQLQSLKEKRNEKKNDELKKKEANDDVYFINGVESHEKLIQLNDNEFDELMNNFDSEFDNLKTIGSMLLHSPFEKEFIRDVLNRWYFKKEHQNEWSVDAFVDKYYERENNNKWFYSIVRCIEDESIKNDWRSRYRYFSVDEDIRINIKDTSFTLSSLNKNNYKLNGGIGIDINHFLTDLKRLIVVINTAEQLFVVKDYDGVRDVAVLSFMNGNQFEKRLKSIKVGKYYKEGKLKEANAFTIYDAGDNKNLFIKDGIRFYDKRDNIFSYFTGYDYKTVDEVDLEKIRPFLNHVREVIANNDEKVYEYIINWFSFVVQNPDGKTETAIVITGKQGTGKNVFSDVLCRLLGRYANKNVSNIDHIVGKFNATLENMKLIVCNELSSAETNKFLNSDAMKTVISDNQIDINQKNQPIRTVQNVVNLILISNNFAPVNVEEGDRRYMMTECSDKYKGDFDYFEKLVNGFDESFYEHLLTYFMNKDISDFNPRRIPMTNIKREVIESKKSCYRLFVEEYYDEMNSEEGLNCVDAYTYYIDFAKRNGFKCCASNTFGSKVRDYVDRKRCRVDGKREYRYFIKEGFVKDDDDEAVDIDFDMKKDIHV